MSTPKTSSNRRKQVSAKPASSSPKPNVQLREQFRELRTDCGFFFTQLFESRHGAETRQPPQLLLIQVRHNTLLRPT